VATERRPAPACALVLALFLLVASIAPAPADPPCTCADDRLRMGWCEAHALGHVAGVEVRSADLFDALDARGHAIEERALDCDVCRQAQRSGGFCERHARGFVDGRAYRSRLTYQVAAGALRDPDALDCPVCRKNAHGHGWCAKCGKGMLSGVEVDGRAAFEQADRAYHVLLEAVKAAERCETCAAAMVADGRCPRCQLTYRDGRPAAD
jgi:hypothetical protein